ncbi:MAG: hypothetical protein B9S32_17185 [Verrucomicrobia bacterium Tous-C9LFEB]|nr:MAG: hypothetical protein B9S32_17185 [Verrucomicrobia bacterium Tous-C9LFEB]
MSRTKDQSLHDERRRQILAAAARVFQLKGFHAARTEEICAQAGLSSGTVFRHFSTKEEIIATIAEMEFAAGFEQLRKLGNREGFLWLSKMRTKDWPILLPPSEFKLGPDSWLEVFRNKQFRKKAIALDCAMRKSLADVLRAGQKAGWVRAELNPTGAASLLLSLFSGLLFDGQTNPELDWSAKAKAMADLVRCYVLAEGVS